MDLNILKDIGGYDEKFINYGYSDTDLTIRCNYFMKWINLSNRISCIHLPHTYANNKECSYLVNEQTFKKNKDYYLYKKKNKLIYNENNSSFKCNTNKLQLQKNRLKKVQVNNNLKNNKKKKHNIIPKQTVKEEYIKEEVITNLIPKQTVKINNNNVNVIDKKKKHKIKNKKRIKKRMQKGSLIF